MPQVTFIPSQEVVTVEAGTELLAAAREAGVEIEAPCGGKGTCGVCKVDVHSGGGALLPTETSHINRGEARKGTRLACQVKVKDDMAIEVDPEIRLPVPARLPEEYVSEVGQRLVLYKRLASAPDEADLGRIVDELLVLDDIGRHDTVDAQQLIAAFDSATASAPSASASSRIPAGFSSRPRSLIFTGVC